MGPASSLNDTIIWFALLGLGLSPVMAGATEVIVGNASVELAGVAGGLRGRPGPLSGRRCWKDEAMDIDAALDYVRTQHHAVLSTLKSDGTPQLSPVTAGVDDDGHVVISTRQTAYKVRNVRRDPRVWLCAFPDQFFGRWVQVEGTADIVELPEAMDGLVEYYRRISGEHPDWDDYRAAMERDKRVLLRISIAKAGPDVSG